MSEDPKEKRSFKILRKSPQVSPFFSRKSTKHGSSDKHSSSDKHDLPTDKHSSSEKHDLPADKCESIDNHHGSADKLLTTSQDEPFTPSPDETANKTFRSFKLKTSSIGKLFKKRRPASYHQSCKLSNELEDMTAAVDPTPREVSFNNIICSTPLINNTCHPSSENTEIEYIIPETDDVFQGEDAHNRSDESGIFSPSFLEEPFSPPNQFKEETQSGLLDRGSPFPIQRESSYDKMLSRLKIPSIELTKPSSNSDLLSQEVKSLESIKDVSIYGEICPSQILQNILIYFKPYLRSI